MAPPDVLGNVIFEFRIPVDDDDYEFSLKSGWNGVASPAAWDDGVYLQQIGIVSGDYIEKRICSVNPAHTTLCIQRRVATTHGGKFLPEFLSVLPSEEVYISDTFASKLGPTLLNGYTLLPVEGESGGTDVPNMHSHIRYIRIDGRAVVKSLRIVSGQNHCSYCNDPTEVLCSECWQLTWGCPTCHKQMYTMSAVPALEERIARVTQTPPVLLARTWDGSDFLRGYQGSSGFVSRRVIDWLEKVHASPFLYRSIDVDISRCSPEQIKLVERAIIPLG